MTDKSNEIPEELLLQEKRLLRGTHSVEPAGGLAHKLMVSKQRGTPLRIKLGLDPTSPDIHLGFAVVLRKLRQFQDLGHQVVLIIGDYTALIGDPSGRSATRPMLSQEEVASNASTYVDQLSRVLDRSRTEVRFNGEWLGKLDFASVVGLLSRMTVAQVLQRHDFKERFEQNHPISLHELMYPLSQAYDSVIIHSDIEMGGLDQTFNILAGRELQKEMGQEPQIGLFMPLLVGLDGVKKMSKSLGNYVGIAESPIDMFSKLMSITDEMMRDYFVLCTDIDLDEMEALLKDCASGVTNPRDVKRRLAQEVVTIYHSKEAAIEADAEWIRVHSSRELPTEIPSAVVPAEVIEEGKVWICKLLVSTGMASGTGEARRLIQQGGVKLDGEKVADATQLISVSQLEGAVLKVGAKRFVKLSVS